VQLPNLIEGEKVTPHGEMISFKIGDVGRRERRHARVAKNFDRIARDKKVMSLLHESFARDSDEAFPAKSDRSTVEKTQIIKIH
jgi:hypothetical protein